MKKTIFLLLLVLIIPSTVLFAEIKLTELNYTQTYRHDRRKGQNLLIYRSELILTAWENNIDIKIIPLAEGRWNTTTDNWTRTEYGIEIGKDIFDWFYFAEDIHHTLRFNDSPAAELETRVKFHHKLFEILKRDFVGYILNEHTFSLKENRATRNEIIVGIKVSLFTHLSSNVNWRHIDWFHNPDSDNFEAGFNLSF